MTKPKNTDALMKHLRNECNIEIHGSKQKKQLISYGYYHGYKGYRFFKKKSTRIPFTNFSEIVAVIEYDNNLKAALYPELMFIETALKNIVCNASIDGLKYSTFDYIYKERMNDDTTNSNLQLNRLRLRNKIYSRLSDTYKHEETNDNKMVRHFYNRGQDAPIWVIFEILYLSELGNFCFCLNKNTRIKILKQLKMYDTSIDTNGNLLSSTIFALKSLRNSVAHNNIIFDARFKDRKVSTILKRWTENETGINNITLYSLIDYIIVICCILKRISFSKERSKTLLRKYEEETKKLQNNVTPEIYNIIIQQNVPEKIQGLKEYINR